MFDLKKDQLGHIVKFKVKLMARGLDSVRGLDVSETFAPTVSGSSVRLLTAIACILDSDLRQFDVQQVFVQSSLKEGVFMRLPQGCGNFVW